MIFKYTCIVLFLILPYALGQNCNRVCLAIWQPVCAVSTRMRVQCTFSNRCYLGVRQCQRPAEGWVYQYDGVCRTSSNRCSQILAS